MPDERLTRQDLIYAANALRQAARAAERQAADPEFISSRGIYERAAKEYDALAAKLDRIAQRMRYPASDQGSSG